MSGLGVDRRRYPDIGDHGFLSDCHSAALVTRDGTVDWACLGRFDAPSTFARLLDADHGGHWSITPVDAVERVERRYLPGTLVLETTFTTAAGVLRLTDALVAPTGVEPEGGALARRVEAVEGTVRVAVELAPRFDDGSARPWIRHHGDGRASALGGHQAVVVAADVGLEHDEEAFALRAHLELEQGSSASFHLVAQPAHRLDPAAADAGRVADELARTTAWWQRWSADTRVEGPHAELLAHSAAVLKGLSFAPTGAIVAAATTSLPEVVGGGANWDYRFCWVRDSTMTLDALDSVGHGDEAGALRDFLVRSSAGHGSEIRVVYGPLGQRSLPERDLGLEGWRGSSPARVGNGAADQLQLDVYGHMLDLARFWEERGRRADDDELRFLVSVVEAAIARRHEPDAGMWETRGEPTHHVHSKVMVWVALDRGIRMVEDHGGHADLDRWRSCRDELRREVDERGVDPDRGNFVQHYGSRAVDAALLKLPLVGFVAADDPRMVATTDAIIDELGEGPHFVRRYRNEQSGGEEGVFLLCTAWLVEVLALQGRVEEARRRFDALLGTANDLGLFTEEWDVGAGMALGNVPQAFTHAGVMGAERRLRQAEAGRGR